MKINTKTELRNIAINHSADIDYNDFLKVYSECTKETYFFFWQVTENYQQVILHDLENFFFFLIKIAVTDQIKILERKLKQNETPYDLDRNAAKISALPSGKLDRDEFLTGEDLNYKPSTAEIAKFDYSPSSEYFNKGLKEEDK